MCFGIRLSESVGTPIGSCVALEVSSPCVARLRYLPWGVFGHQSGPNGGSSCRLSDSCWQCSIPYSVEGQHRPKQRWLCWNSSFLRSLLRLVLNFSYSTASYSRRISWTSAGPSLRGSMRAQKSCCNISLATSQGVAIVVVVVVVVVLFVCPVSLVWELFGSWMVRGWPLRVLWKRFKFQNIWNQEPTNNGTKRPFVRQMGHL